MLDHRVGERAAVKGWQGACTEGVCAHVCACTCSWGWVRFGALGVAGSEHLAFVLQIIHVVFLQACWWYLNICASTTRLQRRLTH